MGKSGLGNEDSAKASEMVMWSGGGDRLNTVVASGVG
jgi:hypothetical protein